jgi:hypothetical protein
MCLNRLPVRNYNLSKEMNTISSKKYNLSFLENLPYLVRKLAPKFDSWLKTNRKSYFWEISQNCLSLLFSFYSSSS